MVPEMIPSSCREFVPNRLYFFIASGQKTVVRGASSPRYFACDESFVFSAYFADFGPLDLGKTASFCTQINTLLEDPHDVAPCIFYCQNHPYIIANSALLMCAYMICCRNASVEEAYGPFVGIEPPLMPFRDAAFAINTFPCSVLDCCRALRKAVDLQHFSLSKFSVKNFAKLSKLENGDLSWIIPGKFIALSGPLWNKRKITGTRESRHTLSPDEYVPVLKELGVTCIVRFNSKCYDKKIFTNAGLKHLDLQYDDGANPPEAILQGFLRLCEIESGIIAVHCKAGLGRTGTNISAFMMKHYGYTAKESIAWCRMCRPGCVVGPQQQFLTSIEARMKSDKQRCAMTEELNRNMSKISMCTLKAAYPCTNDESFNTSSMNDMRANCTMLRDNSDISLRKPFTKCSQSPKLAFENKADVLPVLSSNVEGWKAKRLNLGI